MVTNSMSLALRVPAQRLVEGSSIAGLSLNGGSGVPVTSSVGTVGTAEAAAVEHQAADTSTPGMAEGGEEKPRCPLCPFATDNMDEMNKHETAVTLYGCGVCAKAFALKEELDEHMQSHASRLFSCAVCGAIFVDKEHLEGHMRTHAPPEVFSYGGPGIPPQRARREALEDAHGERNPGCATCGKSFSQKVHLENHVRIHTGERPFSCHVCGKAFRRKEHIGRHMKTHTGERPFCCSVCAKPFGQRAHLLNHLTIHSGERPFSCATCQRTFRLREHAERHARTHAPPTEGPKESKALVRLHKGPIATTTATATMVDPSAATTHRCPLCPFATTSVNDFCKHVVLHAEGRSNCTVCDKKEVVEPLEAPQASTRSGHRGNGGPTLSPALWRVWRDIWGRHRTAVPRSKLPHGACWCHPAALELLLLWSRVQPEGPAGHAHGWPHGSERAYTMERDSTYHRAAS
ncbi:hypothetical protein MTO96_010746 [Rhipicephalus appendiculatus]